MSTALDEAINQRLREQLPPGMPAMIPPPCLSEMQGEALDYKEGESLTMRFPVQARYANPLGNMQGGFIVAALDNTLGPFAYLIAPPSATTSLNTQYLRPVTPSTAYLVCTARLVQRTRNTLYLSAEVCDEDGKVLVMCQAVHQILINK